MPEFEAGSSHIAKAIMTNPTLKAFDYESFLYMGTNLAIMSQVLFHLNAGESKEISFPVTMPMTLGLYPVHLGIFSGGQNVALYKAVDDMVIKAALITLGWQVEAKFPDWYPHARDMWTNQIFRNEYVTTSTGIYTQDTGTGHLTDGCLLGEPPYLKSECIGKTETVWVIEGIRYRVYKLLGAIPEGPQVEVKQYFLGIDNVYAREYWKGQLLTGIPLSFMFNGWVVSDGLFTELESAGVADVTHIYKSTTTFTRMVVHDFDKFFTILKKYDWFTVSVGIPRF